MSTGSIQTNQLFKGLTRPAMLFGVSYMFAILNILICMLIFINTNDFRTFLMLFGVHGLGYIASTKEPLFIELFMVKLRKCSRCSNRLYHGANSYDIT
ncbi:type IV secretion system protein VirB3 [Wolbachia endosymbiont of Dirofilaria (Dirofilaria) immitis]|uniref:type IV secretion system protein VirB3 n=1 Tax=Wolbachia endosymbiont of Dirofilaria (Dirofilaria) immitis TaxID=1812115 RepID=UPI00158E71AC|nr:type IV secretion system protein VirB3 [Wolbachia endosymbiont of Dirofilaria (Dirofilaria) immitis]QKX02075.1 type IV secretion system protein VirB3 [Wolbachia endosymbiont of Dirofilaria (Dirofilaria) immitis]